MQETRVNCAGGIDLNSTLNCGQAFRWIACDDGYLGELDGMAAHVSESGEDLVIKCGDAEKAVGAARVYFDTERDYRAVAGGYSDEPWIKAAFETYPGLRVLRQPVFETVITFIISANNNTGRIARIVNRLCEELGARLPWQGSEAVFTFPEPDAIASVQDDTLRGMGAGYRAPYIRETARMVASGFPLSDLPRLPYDKAHKLLLELPGVGEKVADCILLFSCGHLKAIPVDVWVERVLSGFFPDVKGRKKLKHAAMERFGELGGIAQQVLFHAARKGTIPL